MTEFLFRENPKLTELKAKITSIDGNVVTLDKTIFYSFSGGQESDSGTIAGQEVIKSKKESDEIYYTLKDTSNLKVNDEVDIKIDEEKRDKVTRLHTAMHIVGDIFEKQHNIPISDIVGSNVESKKGRLDYLYPEILTPLLPKLQEEVNKFLAQNHSVEHVEKEGDRWEWSCNGFSCPCGGTHVRNTLEIGKVRLKRKNIGKGKERIEVYLD